MTVSDIRIAAAGQRDCFKSLREKDLMLQKMARSVFINPGSALEIGANVGTAFASRNPEVTLSTLPEVLNFHHTGEGLYLRKFV